jgi:hypothetical protein
MLEDVAWAARLYLFSVETVAGRPYHSLTKLPVEGFELPYHGRPGHGFSQEKHGRDARDPRYSKPSMTISSQKEIARRFEPFLS